MIEGANVSVGRGTDTPFELVGAPWIDSAALLSYLDKRKIPGVRFQSADFIPSADAYAGQQLPRRTDFSRSTASRWIRRRLESS